FDYCALEASSHGIDFHRLGGCSFGVAAFTNFTQDHLDYHKTMEAYLNTKLRLFKWMSEDDAAVVNIDDSFGQRFVDATKAKVLTYALDTKADIMAKNIEYHIAGTRYTLVTSAGEVQVNSGLIGRFNVYNSLCAVGIALSQNISLEQIKSGLEAPIIVAGRFELIDKGQDFSVVVDYAHTPDGMDNVLKMAKALNPKTLITVFGCGGDRDKEKRPIMGGIAGQYSDLVVVTADNPRGENATDISNDIKAGIKDTTVETILDRREAIEHALKTARTGDIIMICGKGHETTQTIGTQTFHFNDREEVEKILETL
ncbi:UDP-N-acetylmuramoyl-L-alanyl-D-glutamate--2,6-diaminopimelate ligase, partial [bacterium]|nr:UDP-N-acetylmuramoyl-L-alanyl-D-glutamate--2,6-diaminopimelate ligase [bacterium]